MLIVKNFHFQQELLQLFSLLQQFQYIHQLIYLSTFFCAYNFYNLNIHQHYMISHIHIHNYLDSKYILYHIHLYQLIFCIHICIYLYSNVVYYCKQLHVIYIDIYTFHVILYALFHQFFTQFFSLVPSLDHTLTFKFFTTSGT